MELCEANTITQGAYMIILNYTFLGGCRRAERSYSMFKVRRGNGEEIPHIQGKEQWLRFAGADMKTYPTSKVDETQVRR